MFIKAILRLDDSTTRNQMWKTDDFAAFINIFEAFNKQCAKNMPSDEFTKIDEALYPTRVTISCTKKTNACEIWLEF